MSEPMYTYQGGRRLELARVTTHFISRAAQRDLLADDFRPMESVSPHSWSVVSSDATVDADIIRARRIAPAYSAYVIADSGVQFLVTDRIFIRFRRTCDATESSARQFAKQHGLALIERLSPRDCLFRVAADADVIETVRRLTESLPGVVEMVDHDLNVQPEDSEFRIDDPLASQQWYLFSESADPHLVSANALVDCQGAWQRLASLDHKLRYGDKNVVISVIDCGCDLTDPNFDDQKFASWAILRDGELYHDDDWSRGRQMMEPTRQHGTICAILAAASANRVGGLGAAPASRLLPVKWQELTAGQSLSHSLFASLIRFLRNQVDIVSNSWNVSPNGYWPPVVVDAIADAVENGGRTGNGVVWVWSAGNHNSPISFESPIRVPTRVTSLPGGMLDVERTATKFVNSVAGLPGVMHVGAISSFGQRCHYSNYGRGLDVVAPSTNRHLYGRLTVAGKEIMAPLRSTGMYPFGGTSAAAPIVAGVAALVRSANPTLTAKQVCSVLRRTADRELVMQGYPKCGRPNDRPNADWDVSPIPPFQSGVFRDVGEDDGPWSPWFGFGKVNAKRAVDEALRDLDDA